VHFRPRAQRLSAECASASCVVLVAVCCTHLLLQEAKKPRKINGHLFFDFFLRPICLNASPATVTSNKNIYILKEVRMLN